MVTKPRLPRAAPGDRQENILAAARQLFVANGFAATSMSAVAARVGGSKATLYKYFASKEKLFEAVMERKCTQARAPLEQPDLALDDVRAVLRSIGGRMLAAVYQPDSVALYRVVQGESLRFPEIARIFFAEGPEKLSRALADRLADFAARGEIGCADPLLTAQQFIAMLKGERHLRVVCGIADAPAAATIAAQVDHAVALFAAGLEAAPRARTAAAA